MARERDSPSCQLIMESQTTENGDSSSPTNSELEEISLLWSRLIKPSVNGSGDSDGSTDTYDRHHHVAQILLIAPIVYGVDYKTAALNQWCQEVPFVKFDTGNIGRSEDSMDKLRAAVSLLVEMYNLYCQEVTKSDLIVIMANVMNSSTLNDALSAANQEEWFTKLCTRSKFTNKREVAAALLIAVVFYHKEKQVDIVEKFRIKCQEGDECSKCYHDEGNKHFAEEKYKQAIRYYTNGLNLHCFSHILFSNRAQTYIKLRQFSEAELDAWRAVCLKCDWPKGHYRLVDAVEKAGECDRAFHLAKEGVRLCEWLCGASADLQALVDFRGSLEKLCREENESSGGQTELIDKSPLVAQSLTGPDSTQNTPIFVRQNETNDSTIPELVSDDSHDDSDDCWQSSKSTNTVSTQSTKKQKKVHSKPAVEKAASPAKTAPARETNFFTDSLQAIQREKLASSSVTSAQTTAMGNCAPTITTIRREKRETSYSESIRNLVNFRENVSNASVALLAQQYRQAAYMYDKSLKRLSSVTLPEKEIVLIKYASGIASLETGNMADVLKSVTLFQEIIRQHSKVHFPLAFYGMARAYLKQNRFKEAVKIAEDGVEVLQKKYTSSPEQLNWPETSVVIDETKTGVKEALENILRVSKNPPRPDALCLYEKGDHLKPEIYRSDPDFKGYVKVSCLERCCLCYHQNCWRSLKDELLQTNDKEFLGKTCLTPDCESIIIQIEHTDETGDIVKQFTHQLEKTAIATKKKTRLEKKMEAKQQKKRKQKPVVEVPPVESEPSEGVPENIMPEEEKESSPAPLIVPTPPPPKTPLKEIKPPQPKINPAQINADKLQPLKRDEDILDYYAKKEEAPTHKNERHRKKEKRKQVLTIDEFLGEENQAFVNGYVARISRLQADRDKVEQGEKWTPNNFNQSPGIFLDPDQPFHIPEHLQGEFEELEVILSRARQTANEKQLAVQENFLSYMKSLLKETGPLHLKDVRLVSELELLPGEIQELIANAGGLKEFLVQSLQFVVMQDFIFDVESFSSPMRAMHLAQKPHPPEPMGQVRTFSSSANKLDALDSFEVESVTNVNAIPTPVNVTSSPVYVTPSTYVRPLPMNFTSSPMTIKPSMYVKPPPVNFTVPTVNVASLLKSVDQSPRNVAPLPVNVSRLPVNVNASSTNDKQSPIIETTVEHCSSTESELSRSDSDLLSDDDSSNNDKDDGYELDDELDDEQGDDDDLDEPDKHDDIEFIDSDIESESKENGGQPTNTTANDTSVDSDCDSLSDVAIERPKRNAAGAASGSGSRREDLLRKEVGGMSAQSLDIMMRNFKFVASALCLSTTTGMQTEPDEELQLLRDELSQLKCENVKLKDRLLSVETEEKEKTLSVQEKHSKETEGLQWENDRLHEELNNTTEQVELLTIHKQTLEEKLEEAEARIDKFNSTILAEKERLIQAEEKCKLLQVELESSKKKMMMPPNMAEPRPVFRPELFGPPQMAANHVGRPSVAHFNSWPSSNMQAPLLPTPPFPYHQLAAFPGFKPPPPMYFMPPTGALASSIPNSAPSQSANVSIATTTSATTSTMSQPSTVTTSTVTSSPQFVSSQPRSTSANHPTPPSSPAFKMQAPPAPAVSKPTVATVKPSAQVVKASAPLGNTNTIPAAATASKVLPPAVVVRPTPPSRFDLDDFSEPGQLTASAKPRTEAPKASGGHSTTETSGPSSLVEPNARRFPQLQSSSSRNSFEKLMSSLHSKFPNSNRTDLKYHVQQLRARRGNTLTGLTIDEIVSELTRMMAAHKQGAVPKAVFAKPNASHTMPLQTPMGLDRIAEPGAAWHKVPAAESHAWETKDVDEDPCIICHEEMKTDVCKLQCMHRFHARCIRLWFREQSTCPTCRVHSVLPDEFPPLM